MVSPFVPFGNRAEPLKQHAAAARILDDMRFLTGLVLALSEDDASHKDLQKIRTTSRWIYDRISALPAQTPVAQHHNSKPEALLTPITPIARYHASPISETPGGRSSGQQSPQDLYPPGPGTSPRGASVSNSAPHAPRKSFPGGGGADYFPHDPHPSSAYVTDGGGGGDDDNATPEVMYEAVRQAALIYSRAIMLRRPLRDAAVCSEEDFLLLWTTVWRAPLRAWRGVLGVFVWVVLCITPAARATPHERFVKSMLEIGLAQMALEDWDAADRGMAGALRLARWLARRGEGGGGGGSSSGSSAQRMAEGSDHGPATLQPAMLDRLGMIAGGKT